MPKTSTIAEENSFCDMVGGARLIVGIALINEAAVAVFLCTVVSLPFLSTTGVGMSLPMVIG